MERGGPHGETDLELRGSVRKHRERSVISFFRRGTIKRVRQKTDRRGKDQQRSGAGQQAMRDPWPSSSKENNSRYAIDLKEPKSGPAQGDIRPDEREEDEG